MDKQTKAYCPECVSKNIILTEHWIGHKIEWQQENGIIDQSKGVSEPGDPYKVTAVCSNCGHEWTFKKVFQITQLII